MKESLRYLGRRSHTGSDGEDRGEVTTTTKNKVKNWSTRLQYHAMTLTQKKEKKKCIFPPLLFSRLSSWG